MNGYYPCDGDLINLTDVYLYVVGQLIVGLSTDDALIANKV